MANQHYRSQFGDTTFTKVFVGGLAWETPSEKMRRYFEQFGEILEAVIITDKNTGRSKGYGFVTFRDPDSARRACVDPNPVIDGRRANCNIASLGRSRPLPPRGRSEGGNPYHGGNTQAANSYNRIQAAPAPPHPPPIPPVIYPYGYATYTPEFGYHQNVYNPHLPQQYYHQMYMPSSSAIASPYHYGHVGYSMETSGASFSASQAHPYRVPPYVQYPLQGEGSVTQSLRSYTFPPPVQIRQPVSVPGSHASDSQTLQQALATTGAVTESAIT
ncbi:uncharacterized protein LOC143848975 isoform X2 [Tasmannia lanceolata]|uniref:uncharacterized protein LOC143848975 isoform X2 n=1 Tax=Tasmannia lanceolata TaxID=3420 RepID=UPI004062AADE